MDIKDDKTIMRPTTPENDKMKVGVHWNENTEKFQVEPIAIAISPDESNCWLLKDRLALYEQYAPKAHRPRNYHARKSKNSGGISGARRNFSRKSSTLHTGDNKSPTQGLSLEEHTTILKRAVNSQTHVLTVAFQKELKVVQQLSEQRESRIKRDHAREVEILANEIKNGLVREGHLKKQLAKAKEDLLVLSRAYEKGMGTNRNDL